MILRVVIFVLLMQDVLAFFQKIEEIQYLTADCEDCGMTMFGSIMTKVCGNVDCCVTPWEQGSFHEGGTDVMSGERIGECNEFGFKSDDLDQDIGVTVFHQGSDALMLDSVTITTDQGTSYLCKMPHELIDDQDFKVAGQCLRI